jgi:hypothetical protein
VSPREFDSDGVHITRSDQQVDIPLSAIQQVRAAEAHTVEVLLTDGTAHRVEGGNPTATAAFVAAEAIRRIALGRRGITVLAEAVGKEGKKTVYNYTDADGGVHRYTCKRTLQRIQLAYDPGKRVRAAHADWLPFVVGRVLVKIVDAPFWLVVGMGYGRCPRCLPCSPIPGRRSGGPRPTWPVSAPALARLCCPRSCGAGGRRVTWTNA